MLTTATRRCGGGWTSSLTLIAAVVDLGGLSDLGLCGLWWHDDGIDLKYWR